MSKETIMLASTFNPEKAKYPLMISEKIDGVAADFYPIVRLGGTRWAARSRDDKSILSVQHLLDFLNDTVKPIKGIHINAELHIEGLDFKDISGISRRKNTDEDTEMLRAHIYDLYIEGKEDTDYIDRYNSILEYVPNLGAMIRRIPSYFVENQDEFDKRYRDIIKSNKSKRPTGCEGVIIRKPTGEDSYYRVAKRPRGFAKLKSTETIDLPIVGFEEAVDAKTNEPLGMVGRLVVKYNGTESGIGPGKLTHIERIELFDTWPLWKGRIAEVAYMPDSSYNGLREGRFWYWRPDKG